MSNVIIKGKETKTGIKFKIRDELGNASYENISFHNYFYILKEDYIENEEGFESVLSGAEIIEDSEGTEYAKCYIKNNFERYQVKNACESNGIKTFESDINAVKRFLIDNQDLELNQENLRVCYFDIETDDRLPLEVDFQRNVVALSPILSYAIKDLKTGEILFEYNKARDKAEFSYDDLLEEEKKLIIKLYADLADFDLAYAYNGLAFDFPYIKQRAEFHDINISKFMQQHIDYMVLYKKYSYETLKSYSLQNVCLYEFKKEIENNPESMTTLTKVDWKEKTNCNSIYELWEHDIKILEEYNIQDVELMNILEEKMKFTDLSIVVSQISHCFFADTVYNSQSFDYAMLNEYKNRNMISPSKPSKDEIEKRGKIRLSGGYTYCYQPGLHIDLDCFDYKSFYPTTAITFNISPDSFVEEKSPSFEALSKIYNENELDFILAVIGSAKDFKMKDGSLNDKKYQANILKLQEEHKLEEDILDMMWKFIDHYDYSDLTQYAIENNYSFTPSDFNLDANGWHIKPHRFYKNEERAVFPELCSMAILTRDKVKYQLSQIEKENGKNNAEYRQKFIYQNALKVFANSGYGTFGFRSFRYFMPEVCDAITTSCRFIMKKSISLAKRNGYDSIFGDTDSSFLKRVNSDLTVKDMDVLFYDYYDDLSKTFNTNANIEMFHPETKVKELKSHFIVFEHEKTFDSCIVVKKKRYYFKQMYRDGTFHYGTQGGAWKKSDTMPFAAKVQKALCKDILDFKYTSDEWFQMIEKIKNHIYTDKLDLDQMVMVKGMSKSHTEYGQPIIDGKSGKQKLRKSDGQPMFAPIPAHVKIAKYFDSINREIKVGDRIQYVIYDRTNNIVPLDRQSYEELKALKEQGIDITDEIKKITYIKESIETLYEGLSAKAKEKFVFNYNKLYDRDYYWDRVESVVTEILFVIDKENIYTKYAELWNITQRQLDKLIADL